MITDRSCIFKPPAAIGPGNSQHRTSSRGFLWFHKLHRIGSPSIVRLEHGDGTDSLEKSFAEVADSFETKCRRLEAALLVSREPISARKLAILFSFQDPTEVRSLAKKLNESYDATGQAFRIEEVAGGMQLLTRAQFAPWLRRLRHIPSEELLSAGMLETLAIVAYRQPVVRAEIEAIRGVNSDEVMRQLLQRDLIRIGGRHEELGRPYLYETTRRFLQLFGLQSLDNLPRAQKIRQAEAEIASSISGRTPSENPSTQSMESSESSRE